MRCCPYYGKSGRDAGTLDEKSEGTGQQARRGAQRGANAENCLDASRKPSCFGVLMWSLLFAMLE